MSGFLFARIGVVLETLRRFRREERGSVFVYATMTLPVLIGLGVLAVDASRLYNLGTSLQQAADSLALAGAAELDRRADSTTRAETAIRNLLANKARFADTLVNVDANAVTWRFLKSLPGLDGNAGNDRTAIGASYEATTGGVLNPSIARFVEVTVTPANLTTILPASIRTVPSTATAVAGFDQAVCSFTPMFICNPFEGSGVDLTTAIKDAAWKRRLLKLKYGGNGNAAQYFPGNFGFLESASGSGANDLRDDFAKVSPDYCFVQNGVTLKTGSVTSIRQGVNVRFDLYEGRYGGSNTYVTDPQYRPAMNVRKGYVGNTCNTQSYDTTQTGARALTEDNCFTTNTCPLPSGMNASMAGRIGDGIWDVNGYFSVNLPGITKPAAWNCTGPGNCPSPVSRYEVYRWEIDNNRTGVNSVGVAAGNGNGGGNGNGNGGGGGVKTENGVPMCYRTPSDINDSPDRRLIYAAMLNCMELDATNKIRGASNGPLPAVAFAKLFVTRPMDAASDDTLYAEMVDLVEGGANRDTDMSRDIVQLYR
ncbi:TadE/TadG family type IV pilus assembly protein [Prosthecomicrobium sp. N25]|uniref:TadE/TadG family type IV pilus assembly protein n=1 Tax=Prosthecomicrobium sp. N25 TaxID=3129254 RepID=UPI003077255D